MPRFNPDKWKPSDDTSDGYKTEDPECVVLNIALDLEHGRIGCPCGCGDFPLGSDAKFAMGHDARLRGKLIRAHLMGVRIRIISNQALGDPMAAESLAEEFGWMSYLDAAVLRREGKNREVLRRALQSERLVKVGRWDFTGQVVSVYRTKKVDMYEIEYVNKAGDVKRVRVPAEEAPLQEDSAS
jgi:hypothetical protein